MKNEETDAYKALWIEALSIQDACNLSGLSKSFADVTSRLWAIDRDFENIGTSWINSNPVTRLWISKFVSLAGEPKTSDWTVPTI